MAGQFPAIQVFASARFEDVDARHVGAKTRFALLAGPDDSIQTHHALELRFEL